VARAEGSAAEDRVLVAQFGSSRLPWELAGSIGMRKRFLKLALNLGCESYRAHIGRRGLLNPLANSMVGCPFTREHE